MNHSKIPLPSSMEGVTGSVNITELWRRHYMELFKCVKCDVFIVDDISHNNVVIRPDGVSYVIRKLALNKSCGLDQISAEHLKFSCHRVSVLLALCFTAMLMHGTLPDSMLSVLLVPVVKDKMGKMSSTDNYKPIALAYRLVPHIGLYIVATDDQFGFKSKHGTDMCIYALKEAVSSYRKHNSTMFMWFLDASSL